MLKQTLLVAGILVAATSASALESTNPFFGPAKGTTASTTSYSFAKGSVKNASAYAKGYDHVVSEKLSYGLTDSVSLDGTVSNDWSKIKVAGLGTDTDDKNIDFELGSTWNALTGKTKLQLSGAYGQRESDSSDNLGAYKYVAGAVKAGYTMGVYTPYVAGRVELPVAQNSNADNHAKYEGKAGLYVYCPRQKWALDNGVRINYDETDESRVVSYDLEASYHLTKNWAISAFGSYALDGQAKYDTEIHDKTIGLRLRTSF
ncbi:MAG: hypothetical protein E7014_02545 [Alphaproteobacteria bacterium]|nr:hypothetical protein [Alphaproteobacteria bacterium]